MALDAQFDERSREHTTLRAGGRSGRKHRPQHIDRVQSTIWLEPFDRDHLRAMADADGISMAEAVEKMVRKEWQRRERRMALDKAA